MTPRDSHPRVRNRSLAYCGVLAIVVIGWSWTFQRPMTAIGGLGWDGAQYAQLAAQCGREPMAALEPFVYRIGAPCLAAVLPVEPRTALWSLNVAASLLLLVLLDRWLRLHVASWVVPWLVAGFALHWLAPLRYVWWYPTYVDALALCAMVAALLLQERRWWFVVACATGTTVRETMLIVPVGLAIGAVVSSAAVARRRPALATFAAGALASVVTMAAVRLIVTPTSDYWMLDAAYYWAYEKPLPRYLLALFTTFGPALALPLVAWRAVLAWVRQHLGEAAIAAAVLVLAWVGGSETDRFLLWAAPIALVAIGLGAESVHWHRHRTVLVVLLATVAISGRWFIPTPDQVPGAPRAWPLLTPLTATNSDLLFSQTPDRLMSAVAAAQYAAVVLVLWIWCGLLARQDARSSSHD
jgi:hypothetical protein